MNDPDLESFIGGIVSIWYALRMQLQVPLQDTLLFDPQEDPWASLLYMCTKFKKSERSPCPAKTNEVMFAVLFIQGRKSVYKEI